MRRGLAAAVLLVPVAEIALAVAVGRAIGVGPTLLALLTLSLVGALVLRETGRRGWEEMRQAAREQVLPQQSSGRGLTLLAGVLLLVPGFLTSAAGLLLLLPPVRAVVRARTKRWADARGAWVINDRFRDGRAPGGPPRSDDDVIRGEVLDD